MAEHETYKVVEHAGGWTYRVGNTFAETFPTRAAAERAASRAAGAQRFEGEDVTITYEDEQGEWHREVAQGNDRPETDVE